ncbi:MAG: alpha/beta hydrolase [Candidatus Aminicenantales bacterium]
MNGIRPGGSGRIAKDDLILVHSFYANSLLLHGFGEFLSDYFNVHFIDLPGFAPHEPPLAEVSLDGFAGHVEARIRELGLDRFILGGISFGFSVVSRVSLPPECRGILAIYPFLGSRSLAMRRRKKLVYRAVVNAMGASGLGGPLWKSPLLERFAFWWSTYPPARVRLILDHMDGRTFFDTARLILNRGDGATFQPLPHVLVLNPDDTTIRADYCERMFEERVKDRCVVRTDLDHYPPDPSADYFRSRFPSGEMDRIVTFLRRPCAEDPGGGAAE